MPLQVGGIIVTTTAVTLVGITSLVAWIVGFGRPRNAYAAFCDVAETVVTDAAWFMPLLFGVVLAILAVLFGQGFTDVDDERADVNRRRLAAASWIVAGVAAGVFLVAAVGAIGRRELAPHLWSVTAATCLVAGAALWVGTVVFGSVQQQLRVNGHTIEDTFRQLVAVPRSNRSQSPLRRFVAGVSGVTGVSTVLALASYWTASLGAETAAPALQLGALLGLAAAASAGGGVLALFAAYFRDSTIKGWPGWLTAFTFAIFFAGLPVSGFLRSVSWNEATGPVALMTSVAFIAPMLSVFLLPRTWLRGFTLRGALDCLRASFIAGRLKSARRERGRLEALVPDAQPPIPPVERRLGQGVLGSGLMRRKRHSGPNSKKLFERPGLCDAVRRALNGPKNLGD